MLSFRCRHLVAAGLILSAVLGANARQVPTGSIAGRLTDEGGGALPGALVEVTPISEGQGVVPSGSAQSILALLAGADGRTVVTGFNGEYRRIGLAPGNYRVDARMVGFWSASGTVVVEAGRTSTWDASLRLVPPRTAAEITADLVGHLTKLAGPLRLDCGEVIEDDGRGFSRQPSLDSGPYQCARESLRSRRPFWFRYRTAGVDSILFNGLVAGDDGLVYRFDYDSGPCGGPGCASRFSATSCPQPTWPDRSSLTSVRCVS